MTSYFRYATSYGKIMVLFGFSDPHNVPLVTFGGKIIFFNFLPIFSHWDSAAQGLTLLIPREGVKSTPQRFPR